MTPYATVRDWRLQLVLAAVAFAAALLLSGSVVPMRVVGAGSDLQPRTLGALATAVPAIVLAATLAEPCGLLAATGSRRLVTIRFVHVFGVCVLGAGFAASISATSDRVESVNAFLVGGALTFASVLSVVLLGRLGAWLGPSVLLIMQFAVLPVSDQVAGWRELALPPTYLAALLALGSGALAVCPVRRLSSEYTK